MQQYIRHYIFSMGTCGNVLGEDSTWSCKILSTLNHPNKIVDDIECNKSSTSLDSTDVTQIVSKFQNSFFDSVDDCFSNTEQHEEA